MKSILILVLLFFSITVFSQNTNKSYDINDLCKNDAWTCNELNTGENINYLSSFEKDVLLIINMVRTNPKKFAELYIKPLINNFNGKVMTDYDGNQVLTFEGNKAVKEAYSTLVKTKPVNKLLPSSGLTKASVELAVDQSTTGNTGHVGSDGSSLNDRIKKYTDVKGLRGENIAYGENNALMVVVSLLIDDGISSRGHRINLLNPLYNYAGIAFNTHPEYEYLCVIKFAERIETSQ